MTPPARTDFRATRARLREDRARLRAWLEAHHGHVPACLWLESRYLCVWLQRWSHWLHGRGHRGLARLVYHLNLMLTGADLPPGSDIGGGWLVTAPVAIVVCGKAGRNFTVGTLSGLGGEMGSDADVGAGPGLPCVGDNVSIGSHAGVLGALRVGNNVTIAAGCVVRKDVPDDCVVEGAAPRIRTRPRAAPGAGPGTDDEP